MFWIIIVIILLIAWGSSSPGTLIAALIILFGSAAAVAASNKEKRQEAAERKREADKRNKDTYEEMKNEYNVSEQSLKVTYKKGYAKIGHMSQYVWIEDTNLCFFPEAVPDKESECTLYKIPLKDIEYFYTQGEIFRETKITGGGGEVGGSSIGGAIVGGVIAGGAGAVIGSRKKGKIEPIKSELVTHDERETYMNFFQNNEKHSIFFAFEDYNTFQRIIPEKDYNSINYKTLQSNTTNNTTSDITKQIKALADLKDSGILTEEEFNEKKKILLDKIQ